MKDPIGRWLHDHFEKHKPLTGTRHYTKYSAFEHARCRYCGKTIVDNMGRGHWTIVDNEKND